MYWFQKRRDEQEARHRKEARNAIRWEFFKRDHPDEAHQMLRSYGDPYYVVASDMATREEAAAAYAGGDLVQVSQVPLVVHLV